MEDALVISGETVVNPMELMRSLELNHYNDLDESTVTSVVT